MFDRLCCCAGLIALNRSLPPAGLASQSGLGMPTLIGAFDHDSCWRTVGEFNSEHRSIAAAPVRPDCRADICQ